MKMIIFLVLAGLSLAAGNTDPSYRWECLFTGLKDAPEVMQGCADFLCEYRGEFEENVENYEKAFNELKDTLASVGCHVDEVLGTVATIEGIAEGTTDVAKHAAEVVLKLTGGLGLNPALTDLFCKLTSGALYSDCLDNILADELPKLIIKLDDLFCTNINTLTSYDICELLQKIGCFGDDALWTDNELEAFFTNLGDALAPTLDGIITSMVNAIAAKKGISVVGDTVCKVLNILSGEDRGLGELIVGLTGVLGV